MRPSPIRLLTALLPIVLLFAGAGALRAEDGPAVDQVRRVVRGFSAIDTAYIEPQHYNYTVMLQTTLNYDVYYIRSYSGQSVLLAPDVPVKVGPYIGWRWIFLGYTFDLKNLNLGSRQKRELDLSIYSSQIGVDLFYRRTGNDYKIRKVYLGDKKDILVNDAIPFDGISVGITGANLYYIFNHKRFSYPAAFSQSTVQKLSCGSWMAGIGYTQNSISLDYNRLKEAVEDNIVHGEAKLDSGFNVNSVKYIDINASCGYGYNWVFAPKWLLAASLSAALGYKHTRSSADGESDKHGFTFNNLSFDGVGRLGLVYNNMRWYAGMSAILHSYSYRKSRFATNNIFGSVNLYIGYNFGLKKHYRKKR